MSYGDHTHTLSHDHGSSLYRLPVYISPNVPAGTLYGTGQSINVSQPTWERLLETTKHYYNQEPLPMTTLQKVQAERRERRERERIDDLYNRYDAMDLDSFAEFTVLRFDVGELPRTRTYAALFVDERWFVTGGSAPNGVASEDFIAWLIGKDVTPDDIAVLGA